MDQTIDNLEDITYRTKRNYKYKLAHVEKLGIRILGLEAEIIDSFEDIKESLKRSQFEDYLNVIIVIRKAKNMEVDELREYRKNFRATIPENTETNERLASRELPSIEELWAYTRNLYLENDYRKFIINFLLLYTNCRNRDLALLIDEKPRSEGVNYLVPKGNSVLFIRKVYKTSDTYGTKETLITDDDFVASVYNMYSGQNFNLLEIDEDMDKKVFDKNISQYVKYRTYNRLGQAIYMKIIASSSDLKSVGKLISNRGTDIGTMFRSYVINKD